MSTLSHVRPVLSEVQRESLLAAAAEMIAATAGERAPVLADASLAGVSELPVSGMFVSLKRQKHLRSCCGGLRPQLVPLGAALAEAVDNTVLRDARFPPVSVGEVAYLDIELWLLFNPQPMHARGEDRVKAVITGGVHGLIVNRGQHHGLLLPGVAADHGWDARTFLEQTCVKAGLHPSLWKDDGTSVHTFEGDALRGSLGRFLEPLESPPFTDRAELEGYFDFCWENIVNIFQGVTPRYFNPSLREIFLTGATLSLRLPERTEALNLTHLSLRPTVPVQNTLLQLAVAGAQQMASHGIRYHLLSQVGMGLTLYADPQMHGTVAAPDLRGVASDRRAVMVIERNKQGIVFQPALAPETLLSEAAAQAQARTPEASAVFSLQAFSTDSSLKFSTAPQPRRGPADRPEGVAGTFYPSDPNELREQVDDLLDYSRSRALPRRAVQAAMVPHAGLRFSGHIAAQVLQSIEIPKLVIVVGPKHTPHGMEWAVAPHQTWKIPGGETLSDFMVARQLCHAIPGLALDAAAHQREHCIEVELPLLARLAPGSRVVGVALGGGDWADACRFAEGLSSVLRALPESPLLLISSDMNHFATDAENRRLDEIALSAIERLDPEAALNTIHENNISMCGVFPAVIVMETLRRLDKLTKATRCGYATSADATGDVSRVVGYAGMLFE